jgi:hypothetical protein
MSPEIIIDYDLPKVGGQSVIVVTHCSWRRASGFRPLTFGLSRVTADRVAFGYRLRLFPMPDLTPTVERLLFP